MDDLDWALQLLLYQYLVSHLLPVFCNQEMQRFVSIHLLRKHTLRLTPIKFLERHHLEIVPKHMMGAPPSQHPEPPNNEVQ